MAEKVGSVYIEIQARMGNIESQLKSLEGRLQKTDTAGAGLTSSMSNLGGYLKGAAIAAAIIGIGKACLSASAAMEQQRVAFGTLLGSATMAEALLSQLQQFAASTPFEFNEIVDASKKLIAFGENAQDVTTTLTRIGDVASGLGVPLGELTEIYGKARVQQTLYAEDLNQLAGRGIPIFEELGKVMGVPANQVKKLGSEGKISFEMLQQVFKNMTSEGGKFGGMMEAQSKTLAGKWSNFKDTLDQLAVTLGDKLAPAAGDFTEFMSDALKSFNGFLSSTAKSGEKDTMGIFKQLDEKWFKGTVDGLQAIEDGIDAVQEKDLDDFFVENYGLFSDDVSEGLDNLLKKQEEQFGAQGKVNAAAYIYKQYVLGYVSLTEAQAENLKRITEEYQKQNQLIGAQIQTGVSRGLDAYKSTQKKKAGDTGSTSEYKKKKEEAEDYYKELNQYLNSKKDEETRIEEDLEANRKQREEEDKKRFDRGLDYAKEYNEKVKLLTEERTAKEADLEAVKFERIKSIYGIAASSIDNIMSDVGELISMYYSNQTATIDNETTRQMDKLETTYAEQLQYLEDQNLSEEEYAQKKKELDEQLAIDEKAIQDQADKDKRKIARDAAKYEKTLALFDVAITTPQAALDAFASLAKYNVVAAGVAAAAATALGVAKYKLINDQPLPALAEGGIIPAIPGGRMVQVAEGGSAEGVIPFDERGVNILSQAMEKAMSRMSGNQSINITLNVDGDTFGAWLYDGSKRGAYRIDSRAVV